MATRNSNRARDPRRTAPVGGPPRPNEAPPAAAVTAGREWVNAPASGPDEYEKQTWEVETRGQVAVWLYDSVLGDYAAVLKRHGDVFDITDVEVDFNLRKFHRSFPDELIPWKNGFLRRVDNPEANTAPSDDDLLEVLETVKDQGEFQAYVDGIESNTLIRRLKQLAVEEKQGTAMHAEVIQKVLEKKFVRHALTPERDD